jgi:hypothetical protein
MGRRLEACKTTGDAFSQFSVAIQRDVVMLRSGIP